MQASLFLVDEDPELLGELSALLRHHGYTVRIATSGADAWPAIEALAPDLVVVDAALHDGMPLCLKLARRQIPVIFASSDETGPTGPDFTTIAKPYRKKAVLAAIHRELTLGRLGEALEHSDQRFKAVTEASSDAIVTADALGRVITWNAAATDLLGWTADAIEGQDLECVMPERFRASHRQGMRRVASGGESRVLGKSVELVALHRSGREVPISLTLTSFKVREAVYFTGILRDISQRKRMEEQLRSITEASADAIVSIDGDGMVLSWNRAASEILGYTEEDLVGESLEIVIPERFRAGHRAGLARVERGGPSRVIGSTVELAALHRSGREVPIELTLSMWSAGDDRFFTGILRDVSQRREAEDALSRYAEELERRDAEIARREQLLARSREALEHANQRAQRMFAAATRSMQGTVLAGRYRIDSPLASGGFGVVCRGHDLEHDATVAIKLFRLPDEEVDDEFQRRFRTEATATMRLAHPGAVKVHDTGITDGGLPWLVMELLEGTTLWAHLKVSGSLPTRRGLELVAQVADVLAAAHDAGVIHRDVKPHNIFLHGPDPQTAPIKVLDFGIAKLQDDGWQGATQTGQLVGTPNYMAPERLGGGQATPASDVYSLGVMLYEVLLGKRPFSSRDPWTTLWEHQHVTAPAMAQLDDNTPPDIDDLAARLLAKDPAHRPTAAACAAELRAIASGTDAALRLDAMVPTSQVTINDLTLMD